MLQLHRARIALNIVYLKQQYINDEINEPSTKASAARWREKQSVLDIDLEAFSRSISFEDRNDKNKSNN